MTLAAAESETSTARPSHCPECDYALDGLPAEGKCPECGSAYDSNFLILRGYEAGGSATYATGTRTRMIWSLCGWTLFFVYQLFQLRMTSQLNRPSDWLVTAFVFGLMAWSMLQLIWKRSALDGPPCQLWLSPSGYWLRDRTTDNQRRDNSRSWIAGLLFALVIAVIIVYMTPVVGVIFFCVAVVPVALIWRFARADPPPTVTTRMGHGEPIVLNAWEPRTRSFVEWKSNGVYRVRIVPDIGPFWKLDLRRQQELLTKMSDREAVSLIKWLAEWIGASGTR